jgi:predicted RNA-binding protein YlqC (UPF0109 family)
LSSIDQQFIEFVVKSLVGKPDAVQVNRRIDEKGVLLELTVDPEDLGRVIGKRGATAQSLRTLLRALGTKNDARYNLKIIDNSPEGAKREPVVENEANEAPPTQRKRDADKPIPGEVDEAEAIPEPPEEETDKTSDRLRQAREELADLDDLDV